MISRGFVLFYLLTGSLCFAQAKYDFVVAKDGSGNFKTVQEAIDAVPDFRKKVTTIFINNGTYKEKLILPASKTMVKLIGEDKNKTILTYDDYASKKNRFGEEMGTTGSSSFFIFGDDFTAENITFENSSGPVGQAVAVRIDGGDKVMFKNCRFLGYQDTLYPHGENSRQYYKDCYIEGTVDFIFGWSTAVFDNCEIFCKNSGYITAASTNPDTQYGFVFINCKITGNSEAGTFYLGRPWRPYAKTVFINCTYSISAQNLANDVVVTPPPGFEVSPDNGNTWYTNATPLTLAHNNGILSGITITIRLNAGAPGSYSGNIIHSSEANGEFNLRVNGMVQENVVTGVKESIPKSFRLSPNPTRDQVVITSFTQTKSIISVRDTNGITVGEYTSNFATGDLYIDTSHLPAGLYIVDCRSDTENTILKFIRY